MRLGRNLTLPSSEWLLLHKPDLYYNHINIHGDLWNYDNTLWWFGGVGGLFC